MNQLPMEALLALRKTVYMKDLRNLKRGTIVSANKIV